MISDELKKIYSNTTSDVILDTITLTHSLFTKDWRFVLDNEPCTFESLEYTPLNFSLVLPTIGSEQQDITIVMDNTNLQLVGELNLASGALDESITLTYMSYIKGKSTTYENKIILALSNIKYNSTQVTAVASASNTVGKTILASYYDSRYKGL